MKFTVVGIPVPQGSMRAFANPRGGRPVVTADNPRTKPWKSAVTAAAAEAREQTFTGPVAVTMAFRFPRPASHFGSGRNAGHVRGSAPSAPATRPDLDKLIRAVLDAMTAAAIWHDDAQVVQVIATKSYTDDVPGLTVDAW